MSQSLPELRAVKKALQRVRRAERDLDEERQALYTSMLAAHDSGHRHRCHRPHARRLPPARAGAAKAARARRRLERVGDELGRQAQRRLAAPVREQTLDALGAEDLELVNLLWRQLVFGGL